METAWVETNNQVFPVDAARNQTSDVPFTIISNQTETGAYYGFYLQDEWKVFEALTINFGARFDIVDEYAHAYRLSPRVNIVLQATGSTTLHARLCPLLYTASAGACTVTNPETVRRHIQPTGDLQSTVVKPERANYFDAGMTEQFTRSFSMGIDSYYKTSRDLIDEGQFGSALNFYAV